MIDHAALTDSVLAWLAGATGELIGDGIAPVEGGWLQGQPNVEAFVPYAVLIDGGAIPTAAQRLKMSRPDWTCTFSMRYFGGSRKQCEWIATKFRINLEGLRELVFGVDDPHEVMSIDPYSYGAVMRNDQVDPPYWQVFDTLQLLCTPQSAAGYE